MAGVFEKVMDARHAIVQDMVAMMEKGYFHNRDEWDRAALRPGNPISGVWYKGGNRLRLMMAVMKHTLKNKYVQAVMRGLQACVIGVITAVGAYMLYQNALRPAAEGEADIRPLAVAAVLAVLYFGSRKVKFMKKGLSPIMLIGISACIGIIAFGLI